MSHISQCAIFTLNVLEQSKMFMPCRCRYCWRQKKLFLGGGRGAGGSIHFTLLLTLASFSLCCLCILCTVVWMWRMFLAHLCDLVVWASVCVEVHTQVLLKHELSFRVLFSVLHHSVYPFSHLLNHQLSVTKS